LLCLRAAVENGADAVYFGLHGHNARARAANFDLGSLPEVMHLLHRRGVRGYVTLNTLVFPSELAEIEGILRGVALAGADAIIVQDIAVIRLARAMCPDLPIHASTQMTLTSAESIRLVEELGVQRVILARELSLDDMRRICAGTQMPLEVFVHGALCVAYSGQCLTSEALGGRSANRGQCAQACRLPYEVISDGQPQELGDYQYVLSPQDLAAWDVIPELVKLGIACFKIEGRLKTPEYVANITRHYRQAIDAAVAGHPALFTRRDVEEMELSFSRGFSHGWMLGDNHKVLVQGRSPSKRGVFLGEVQSVRGGRVALQLAAPLKRGDGVVFDRGRPEEPEQGGRVYELFRDGRSLEEGVSTGLVELAFGRGDIDFKQVSPGNRVWKTDDPELTRRLRQSYTGSEPNRRLPLDVRVTARVGERLRIVARAA
jgi:putative protease